MVNKPGWGLGNYLLKTNNYKQHLFSEISENHESQKINYFLDLIVIISKYLVKMP